MFDFLSSYEKAFIELVEYGVKVINESIDKTEKDLGRSIFSKDREFLQKVGAVAFTIKCFEIATRKGDK